MYCPSCGTVVPADSEVCTKCKYIINPNLFQFEEEKHNTELIEIDIKKNKFFAVLAYLGPLIVISFTKSKSSKYARFHCNQGIITLVMFVLSALLFLIPNIGAGIGVALIFFTLSITAIGTFNAIKGETKELPIVGKIKILN